MNYQHQSLCRFGQQLASSWGTRWPLGAAFVALGWIAVVGGTLQAADQGTVGQCVSRPGSVLRRPGGATEWQVLKKGDAVSSGDTLVALPGAAIESESRAVRLSLLEDLGGQSHYPIVETAVILRESKGADLAFTLDRGRVTVANIKKEGAARVRVGFRGETWELTLAEPGSRVALEIYGRWPAGVRFTKNPKPEDAPTSDVVLLVLDGQAELKAGTHEYALRAPPGPAYFHWDSSTGVDATPGRLETLPDWANPKAPIPASARQVRARAEMLRTHLAKSSLGEAVADAYQSGDATYRRMAVHVFGALDDLGNLTAALVDGQRSDVREAAVQALRHWIGRGPGQDMKLHDFLIERKGYKPVQAEIILQLLHGLDENDRKRPETYESLIAYLRHDQLAVRELASWHLYRLAAAGREIAYDAAGPPAEREKAYRAWKELIPDGQLPPKAKKN